MGTKEFKEPRELVAHQELVDAMEETVNAVQEGALELLESQVHLVDRVLKAKKAGKESRVYPVNQESRAHLA